MIAGDTHDLEHYAEPADATGYAMQHLVNGGGGAYLSFGSALGLAASALGTWAYFPSSASVVDKIETYTPWWKRPAWWWTRSFDAWPFSAEWLSAVFDYNTAPFFQSVEVRVEADRLIVRLRRARSAPLARLRSLGVPRRPSTIEAGRFRRWSSLRPAAR